MYGMERQKQLQAVRIKNLQRGVRIEHSRASRGGVLVGRAGMEWLS